MSTKEKKNYLYENCRLFYITHITGSYFDFFLKIFEFLPFLMKLVHTQKLFYLLGFSDQSSFFFFFLPYLFCTFLEMNV